MKRKSLLLCSSIILGLTNFAQNNAWILAPNYHHVSVGSFGLSQPLPTTSGGYTGAAAASAQNIQMDANGNILFFIVDGKIYGKNGELIDEIRDDYYDAPIAPGENSEMVVIPDRDNCNLFHILTTRYLIGTVEYSRAYYAKLRIVYNAQGNVSAESGLQHVNLPWDDRLIEFGDIAGPDFYANNNTHDECALFAVVPDDTGSGYKVFVENGQRIFRFSINNETFSYDNYFINFITFCNLQSGGNEVQRGELEAIRLSNGNIRLGRSGFFQTPSHLPVNGIITIDANSSGTFIVNSHKLCEYTSNLFTVPTYQKVIGGFEFSADGNKVFVSHQKYTPTNSTLDYWDISGSTPVVYQLSTLADLSTGQLEMAKDGNIYLPRQNYLARISNTNSTPTFNSTAVSIGTYNLSTGTYDQGSPNTLLRILQDQIDGSTVYDNVEPSTFHAVTYNVTSGSTWNGGSNPIAPGQSVINIEKELRIKAGVSLTIQNMIIRFAPGARLVIENGMGSGQGGKLLLNNTTLTNYEVCDEESLWLGVEVWGNSAAAQGTITNSTQGVFRMQNNSKIEHAYIGVLLSTRTYNIYLPFDPSKTGGVVVTDASDFYNCQTGVLFLWYNVGTTNLSRINNTTFRWNGALKNPSLKPLYHILINQCTDITITTSKFYQETPDFHSLLTDRGKGIHAVNSTFNVYSSCSTTPPFGHDCPESNVIPSEFKGLHTGIYVSNSNSKPFIVLRNTFENCIQGVSSFVAKNQNISRNKFLIPQNTTTITSGISVTQGTGYTIAENLLEGMSTGALNDVKSYGIIIDNSGDDPNEVYKNTFKRLNVGTQAQGNNASIYIPGVNDNAGGLRYNCNVFQTPIAKADIGVAINSRIDYEQGRALGSTIQERRKNAARNEFTRTGAPHFDILLSTGSQAMTYVHLGNTPHIPYHYSQTSPSDVSLSQQLWAGLSVFADEATCPTKFPAIWWPPIIIFPAGKMAEVDSLSGIIDGGKTSDLLELIATQPTSENTFQELIEVSPYLSDRVLENYLNSDAPNIYIKEVLIENSKLSDYIMNVIKQSSKAELLNSDISLYQNKVSAQQIVYDQLKIAKEELYNGQKEFIASILADTTIKTTDTLVKYLELSRGISFKKTLLSVYSTIQEHGKFNTLLDELSDFLSNDLIELYKVQYTLAGFQSMESAIENESSFLLKLSVLNESKDENVAQTVSRTLTQLNRGIPELEIFPLATNVSQEAMVLQQESIKAKSLQTVQLFPNPSEGIVHFNFSELESKSVIVQLVDLTGKEVFSTQFSNTLSEKIDFSHLRKGIYLVRVVIDDLHTDAQLLILE